MGFYYDVLQFDSHFSRLLILRFHNCYMHSFTDNKLLDLFPKHQLFYMMGIAYGVMFTFMGLMLMHPTFGLPNTQADPSRLLGWVSYVTIEVKKKIKVCILRLFFSDKCPRSPQKH